MTRFEQSWVADVLNAFTHDAEPALSPRPGEVDYASAFVRMRRGSTALAGLGLRAALWMVALAPLWFMGRLVTFSRLARRERTDLLIKLLVHRSFVVRELTMLLKLTAAMALLGSVSVRARSGYDSVTLPALVETRTRVQLPILPHTTAESANTHSDPCEVQRVAS